MSAGFKDTAASDPHDPPDSDAGLPGTDAATIDHLRRWLVRMAGIAVQLADRMNRTAGRRRAKPDAERAVDHDVPDDGVTNHDVADHDVIWALVTRATRWTCALQARLMAEVKAAAKIVFAAEFAAAKAVRERRESRPDGPDKAPVGRKRRARASAGAIPPERCIDGKSMAEVVAQICADIGAAAALMHDGPAVKEIAAIAEAARALLGGPAEYWTALPVPSRPDRPAGEAETPMMPAVPPPGDVSAPDTG